MHVTLVYTGHIRRAQTASLRYRHTTYAKVTRAVLLSAVDALMIQNLWLHSNCYEENWTMVPLKLIKHLPNASRKAFPKS